MSMHTCSKYCNPVQLPPGARTMRCTICRTVSSLGDAWDTFRPPAAYAAVAPYNVHYVRRAIRPLTMSMHTCSKCCNLVQLPPGARTMRCTICRTVSSLGDAWDAFRPPAAYAAVAPYNVHAPVRSRQNCPGRKRAVICGISYKKSRHELKGSINDAKCMLHFLVNNFRFPLDSILMLTEEESDPQRIPTKRNIKWAMRWLVQGCQPGDSLVFYFSGHGWQQRDYSGDEADGYDETICPLDFETQGMIVDDEINALIVRPIPLGVKLHAIVDASHSGTVLDLPYLCRINWKGQYAWEDHRPRSGAPKGTSGGQVICFSGCDDDQDAADTFGLPDNKPCGAMTNSFIGAIDRGQGSTYGSILSSMRSFNIPGLRGRQEAQLTASHPFDVCATPFSL
ncbi:metacaspase-1 [Morus notabilis]|nr:metacaspase-1 [Morus notabilis]